MNEIAMYIGYTIIIICSIVGVVMVTMVLAAKIGDKLPYFISYNSVMKKNEDDFKKWVESVEWVYKNQKFHTKKRSRE